MTDIPKRSRDTGRYNKKYTSDMCDTLLEIMARGGSKTEVCANLNIGRETLTSWMRGEDLTIAEAVEFKDAITLGEVLSQAWWERAGRDGMYLDRFNAAVWCKSISHRFPNEWSERSETTLKGDANNPLAFTGIQITPVKGHT